ncbi:TIGR02757 family protein [Reichenbachiella sp.]|uniref:TIGR02757 family protein n=1 Tax=Reichenbachiella sp. TaxID=2184521 RepID=UPI003B5A3143
MIRFLFPGNLQKKQDIEIMGFWTAILSWGRRQTIIDKANLLVSIMDGAPHDFIINHREQEREKFLGFKHRTFNEVDALYFLHILQWYYRRYDSLEDAFTGKMTSEDDHIGPGLIGFRELFFSPDVIPQRTRKHVSSPLKGSACKRLNMFLRWMVRTDDRGVDFGLWKQIRSDQLLIPLDVHVGRVARQLGLLKRKQNDWKAVLELTTQLKQFDSSDPIRYDFALFGMGLDDE